MSRVVHLRSGGYIVLSLDGDPLRLARRDRKLVEAMLDRCDDYERPRGLVDERKPTGAA